MLDFLKINQIIEIEVEQETDFSGTYKTRIEDIKQDGIAIGMPIDKGGYVPLRPGQEVIIWHWDNSASYAYYCIVRDRSFETIPLIFLEWPYKTKKIQRRGSVRVPTNLPLEYKLGNEDAFNKTFIRDLSGGGAQFVSKRKLIKGDILKINVFLPTEIISCTAKVRRVYTEVKNDNQRYLIGMEFIDIPEKISDKLIKYVFQRQRELIRKGVL
ncbi:MAG: hypothetical protein JM58_03945 [Peptococcaceae bacterium BICA1-8]|nr:MAG: hypothetical protein JM58_03945 [Peptococcaceae bacterium BICA1-8]